MGRYIIVDADDVDVNVEVKFEACS